MTAMSYVHSRRQIIGGSSGQPLTPAKNIFRTLEVVVHVAGRRHDGGVADAAVDGAGQVLHAGALRSELAVARDLHLEPLQRLPVLLVLLACRHEQG